MAVGRVREVVGKSTGKSANGGCGRSQAGVDGDGIIGCFVSTIPTRQHMCKHAGSWWDVCPGGRGQPD